MAKTIGIGVEAFNEIIENDYFYVDKTGFIKEWWENGDKATLITRPRRFGKTLTMSMTEQFFSVKYAGRWDLFKHLSIWNDEKYRKMQGTYPVVSLSFANIKERTYQETYQGICSLIARECRRWDFLLEADCLSQVEKEDFQKILRRDMPEQEAAMACNLLSEFLCRYYGKKVIILLDEYDTPMQEAYIHGYWDELAHFTRRMFHAAFKSNPWLARAVLTGITRVSRESVFSDLNNLKVITTTSRKYESVFGFTETELLHALEEYGRKDQKDQVKQWYDGFRFGGCGSIYNPWSILNYLDEGKFRPYWVNTSSNKLIGTLLRGSDAGIKLIMEDLLNGRSFWTRIDEEIIFKQLDSKKTAIWSLLLASGYLKVDAVHQNAGGQDEYMLSLTNREVGMMFGQMAAGWFSNDRLDYHDFSQALISGDKFFMNQYVNEIAQETFSYFDTGARTGTGKKQWKTSRPENFYHGFTLGLIADLRSLYRITSNRESGIGRYDVMLDPLKPEQNDAVILEFKVHDAKSEEKLQDTVLAALQQIIDKNYAAALTAKGILKKQIRIYGFAFQGKQVLIDGGWIADYE